MTASLAISSSPALARIDNLADYLAGLLAIQRRGIPQHVWVHPQDQASLLAAIAGHSPAAR